MSESASQRVKRDMLAGAMAVGLFTLLTLKWQWSEAINLWFRQYEWLDLDEIVLSAWSLMIVLCWFAARRWLDLHTQLEHNEKLQHQRDQLLQHNRELSQRVLSAQEDERRELARELHDEIAQICTVIRYEAAFIEREVKEGSAAQAAQRIEQAATSMHEMTRTMLKRLRPAHLDSLGFEDALMALCQQWQDQTQIPCHCNLQTDSQAWTDYAKTSLYRVVQEALTNVARHAQATSVSVKLVEEKNTLSLMIDDDGKGIVETDLTSSASQHGLGMLGIRERIASLQGHVEWVALTPGVRLKCEMPLQEIIA
jgi:two-component system, NarL family, sensor histidine kinase FusK